MSGQILVIGVDAEVVTEQMVQVGFQASACALDHSARDNKAMRDIMTAFEQLNECQVVVFSANTDEFSNTYSNTLFGAALALDKKIIVDHSRRLEFGFNPFLMLPPVVHCHNKNQLYEHLSEVCLG
jgi:hypothetical protein